MYTNINERKYGRLQPFTTIEFQAPYFISFTLKIKVTVLLYSLFMMTGLSYQDKLFYFNPLQNKLYLILGRIYHCIVILRLNLIRIYWSTLTLN